MARYSIIVVGKEVNSKTYCIGTNHFRVGVNLQLIASNNLVHDTLRQAIKAKQRLIKQDKEKRK